MKNIYKFGSFLIIVLVFLLGFLAVYTNPLFLGINNLYSFFNFSQRSFGLTALVLLSVQIFLGAFKNILVKKLGGWIVAYHRIIGIIAFGVVVLHPISLLISTFISKRIIDPFYIFSDFCLLCPSKSELFITLGRVSFWLIGLVVLTGFLRKQIHLLAYPVFIFVAVHAWFLGSDIHTKIYYPVYWGSILLVLSSLLGKIYFLKKHE